MEVPAPGEAPLDVDAQGSAQTQLRGFSSQLGDTLRAQVSVRNSLIAVRSSISQSVTAATQSVMGATQSSTDSYEIEWAAPPAAEPSVEEEEEEAEGTGMSICIHPNIDLELLIMGAPLDGATNCVRRYEVNGPHSKVAMLAKLLKRHADKRSRRGASSPRETSSSVSEPATAAATAGSCDASTPKERSSGRNSAGSGGEKKAKPIVSGLLSPLHPVNLPIESRKGTGVPAAAAHFAFCYPADGMEKVLEPLNLTDQPWAFILLLGGFIYFDESFNTCGINSIGLAGSKIMLDFVGPFSARQPAMDALDVEKRLCAVTLEALEDQGLASFGWIHPNESPGGERLHRKHDYPWGGFVYMRKHEPPIFFVLSASEVGKSASGGKDRERIRGTVGGGAVNALVEGLRGLAARVRKDMETTAKEIDEVKLLTTGRARGASLSEDPSREQMLRRWWRQWFVVDLVHWLRFSTPIVSGLCFLVFCGSVAQYDRGTYKVLGCFLWYAMHMEITWRPFHDTAGLCILQNSKRGMRLLYALLFGTPLLIGLLRFAWSWMGYSRAWVETEQALLEALGVATIYLAVPLTLYGLRRMAARQVKRNVSLQARTVDSLVKWKHDVHEVPVARNELHDSCSSSRGPHDSEMYRRAGVGDTPPSPPSSPPPSDATPSSQLHRATFTVEPPSPSELVIDAPTDASHVKPRAADKEHTIEYKVAVRFQAAIRRSQARRRVAQLLAEREASLLRFCWPIFLATLVDIVGTTVLVDVRQLISNTHTTTLRARLPARFHRVGYHTNHVLTLRACTVLPSPRQDSVQCDPIFAAAAAARPIRAFQGLGAQEHAAFLAHSLPLLCRRALPPLASCHSGGRRHLG